MLIIFSKNVIQSIIKDLIKFLKLWFFYSNRNLDGVCNNLKNPLWGNAGSPLVRLIKANYR